MLLKLNYVPENFDPLLGIRLSQRNVLQFSQPRLLWSAITVGRASWNKVIESGMYSAFEIIYRGSLLLANLEISKTGKLTQSSAYKNLDPSEKSAISYFIGLTFTKLLAQKLFNVNWLMHLDVYKKQLTLPIIDSRSRPDLVGIDKSNQWFTFEAKGRTGPANKATKTKAKSQVNQLEYINGIKVHLGIGLISYFNSSDHLEVYLKDPPIEHGLSLELNKSTFLSDYYRLFIDLINSDYSQTETIPFHNRKYLVKYIKEMDIKIGIDEEIHNYAQDHHKSEILERVVNSLPDSLDEPQNSTENFIGEDGVFVRLGEHWTSRFTENR